MVIIQLLKDTKYPTNYQIIIDSSLGNYAVLRDFFSALHEDMVVHGLCGRVTDSARNACSLNCCCLVGGAGDLQEGYFALPDANFLSSWCQFPFSRAQNRHFCALLPSETPVFGLFEHKIEVFVVFWPSGPPF